MKYYRYLLIAISLFILIVIFLAFCFKKNTKINFLEPRRNYCLPVTLDCIFSKDHSWVGGMPKEQIVQLVTTGDIIMARSINYQIEKGEKDSKWFFQKVHDVLVKADMNIINFESPIVKICPPTKDRVTKFCSNEKIIDGLKYARIDIANLANNHIDDYAQDGINNTLTLLENAGITSAGIRNPVFKEVKNIRFAFLGYNDVPKIGDGNVLGNIEKIKSEISQAQQRADVVIVSFHWGIQYTDQPTKRQQQLAHLAIDAGADIVIGNHPHWIQPVEVYKDRLIIYSHGNFIFDQLWSEKTRIGIISRLYFYDKKLVDVEFFPIRIGDFGQPYFLSGIERKKILTTLEEDSKQSLEAIQFNN